MQARQCNATRPVITANLVAGSRVVSMSCFVPHMHTIAARRTVLLTRGQQLVTGWKTSNFKRMKSEQSNNPNNQLKN